MDIEVDVTGVIIETERLILRPWEESDLRDFHEYASVPGVGEMAGWVCHDSFNTSMKILILFMEERNVFAIVHKQDDKVIGSFGIHPSRVNGDDEYKGLKIKEFGYVLSKSYWGQGLMPEAVNAVAGYCFGELKLDAVTCSHFRENYQSKRVIEKCGFVYFREGECYSKQLKRTFNDVGYILYRNS